VKQKVSGQDKKNNQASKSKSSSRNSKKKPSNKGPKKKRQAPHKSKLNINELPRPTYDQLDGGRTGKTQKKGLVGFIKNLFSS
jgi:hypothetical protein